MLYLGVCCVLGQNVHDKIAKGNVLIISIKGVPTTEQAQVNGNYHVGATGSIKIPLTGTIIKVQGLTNDQLERKIEQIYKSNKIYQEPVIEVIVKGVDGVAKQTLSIGGHVHRAGPVAWEQGMTLIQAIQAAGDRNAFGSKYVYLTRNGKRHKFNINLPAHQGLLVYPKDTVTVKQRGAFE